MEAVEQLFGLYSGRRCVELIKLKLKINVGTYGYTINDFVLVISSTKI